jgi:hypothetical protein
MNNHFKLGILVLGIVVLFSCNKEKIHTTGLLQKLNDVEKAFEAIDTIPEVIKYTNSFPIPDKGNGHIQSAQVLDVERTRYVILTGSSDSTSYSAVVKLDNIKGHKVVSINHLLDNPFSHAGGTQLLGSYMGVGIEDNVLKDKSKVRIYNFYNPEAPIKNPIFELMRTGEYKRSTAGGVGLIEWQGHIIMLVVDWDGINLDFYTCPVEAWNLSNLEFKLWKTLKTASLDKQGWIDNEWRSYQNINLICDKNNQLYALGLDGFGKEKTISVADLYQLNLGSIGDNSPISIKKISRRKFQCTNSVNFSLGAGVHIIDENSFGIIATGGTIKSDSYLNYFK